MRKLLLSLMLAMALAIGSAGTAVAAPPAGSYTDTVVGIETAVPTGPSMFAGYASGQLPGLWTASVIHGPLPINVGEQAGIASGSFFALRGRFGVVSGGFDPNPIAITMLGSSAGGGFCTQRYRVDDTLSLVQPSSFHATLTHYGYGGPGGCHIFFATVRGIVTLTLS